MKENTLLKIALVCSIIGIALLFIVSQSIGVDEKSIGQIDMASIGEYVKINGAVTNVVDKENVMILTIEQPSKINVVLFKKKPVELREGNYVEVIGKIDDYEGKPELIGDKVRVIS